MKAFILALLMSIGMFTMAQNYAPLAVFPNPAADHVYVQVPENFKGITYIYVTDLSGKVYYSQQQNFDTYDTNLFKRVRIGLDDIPDGYYVVNVRNQNDWRAQKFSKSPVTLPQ